MYRNVIKARLVEENCQASISELIKRGETKVIYVCSEWLERDQEAIKEFIQSCKIKWDVEIAIYLKGKRVDKIEGIKWKNKEIIEMIKRVYGNEQRSVIIDTRISPKQYSYLSCMGIDKVYIKHKMKRGKVNKIMEYWPEWN